MTRCGKQQLVKHKPFLSRVVNSRDLNERKYLIKRATPEQLKVITGIVYNTLKGRFLNNSKTAQKHVHKNRGKLVKFVNSCCSPTLSSKDKVHIKPEGVDQIRKQLTEQRGGIFPALIPLLALAGKAILAGAISSGVGVGVKKLIDR